MRVISKNALMQQLTQSSGEYVSKTKLLYWFATFGYDIDMKEEPQNGEESHE